MPKITVSIEWDTPDDPFWLNPDNVSLALHAYCKNTHFVVRDAAQQVVAADAAGDDDSENPYLLSGDERARAEAELQC